LASSSLSYLLWRKGAFEEALSAARRSAGEYAALAGPAHPNVAYALEPCALVEVDLGDFDAALADAQRAAQILRSAEGDNHTDTASARACVALAVLGKGDAATAVRELSAALRTLRTGTEDRAGIFEAQLYLVAALVARGDLAEGERELTSAEAALKDLRHAVRFGRPIRKADSVLECLLRPTRWVRSSRALPDRRHGTRDLLARSGWATGCVLVVRPSGSRSISRNPLGLASMSA
jgi:tetratricopeptide (TPR) repeat protein